MLSPAEEMADAAARTALGSRCVWSRAVKGFGFRMSGLGCFGGYGSCISGFGVGIVLVLLLSTGRRAFEPAGQHPKGPST